MRLERAGTGWRLGLNRSVALGGGLAGSAPRDSERLRERTAVMVAGGPLASLALGLAALSACWALGVTPPSAATTYPQRLGAVLLLTLWWHIDAHRVRHARPHADRRIPE
jgi:hypothetical protein